MDHNFWHERWRTGQLGFHLAAPNPRLVEHARTLVQNRPERILVPLCGKSVDLTWLAQRAPTEAGPQVVGVELSRIAAAAYFEERGVIPEVSERGGYERFTHENLTIAVGDFFEAQPSTLGTFDAVYDRAALVALPHDMRERYVATVRRVLRPGGRILLVVFDFDNPNGPPFSVPEDAVRALFAGAAVAKLAEHDIAATSANLLARGATYVMERVFDIQAER